MLWAFFFFKRRDASQISGMDMPLDAIVTDIEAVPEALRSEYVEKDGKFFLQVTPVDGWDLQDINGLTTSLRAERNLKAQAEKALLPFKDLDPTTARSALAALAELDGMTAAEAKAFKAEVERLQAIDPKAKADEIAQSKVDAAKAEWERTFGTKQSEWQTALEAAKTAENTARAQLKVLLVDNQIKAELGKVRLVEGLQPAVELLISRQVQVTEKDGVISTAVVDAAGNARDKLVGTSLVPFTVSDLINELKVSTPGFFQAEDKAGTGISPSSAPPRSSVVNPWAKETLNRTQQVVLTKTQPSLAAQLKAQAGVA
jgi:hypothetical protein